MRVRAELQRLVDREASGGVALEQGLDEAAQVGRHALGQRRVLAWLGLGLGLG